MKSVQKFSLAGRGAQLCAGLAGLALGLGLVAPEAGAQQYQSTYGSSGGSVVIDPDVLNSMGGPAVTTQGNAIIQIPGTGATLLAPPSNTPHSRVLVSGSSGDGTAGGGSAAAPARAPSSRLLVAPATQAPTATAAAPQLRPPQSQSQPQAKPKVASVSGETPPPPQPTGFKEAEPEAPQPMTTEKPAPPPRATAVEESDKAADAAPPEAAPSPGADSTAPAMAEDKTELKSAEETMSEAKTAVEEKPMAKAPQAPSAPELPKTPEVAKTEPTAPAAKEPADTTSSGSQTASLPRAGTGIDERLLFDTDQDELTDEMRNQLSDIAKTLLADESQRIELRGYADAAGNNAGAARRVSLKRAVSVRRYLMDQGVRSTRIDVRALGDKDETGGPPDRVDLILSQ